MRSRQVNDQQLPGGILVRNLDQPQYAAITLADEGAWANMPFYMANAAHLVFDDYDGKYFLHEARGPVATLNLKFPVTKAEKSVRTLALNASQTTIVAGE